MSHRLAEVLELSDRITVLRDGRHVGTVATSDTSERALIRMMVGRDVGGLFTRPDRTPGDPVIEISDLSTERVSHITFSVRRARSLDWPGSWAPGGVQSRGASTASTA